MVRLDKAPAPVRAPFLAWDNHFKTIFTNVAPMGALKIRNIPQHAIILFPWCMGEQWLLNIKSLDIEAIQLYLVLGLDESNAPKTVAGFKQAQEEERKCTIIQEGAEQEM
jgi:hypothetical protein